MRKKGFERFVLNFFERNKNAVDPNKNLIVAEVDDPVFGNTEIVVYYFDGNCYILVRMNSHVEVLSLYYHRVYKCDYSRRRLDHDSTVRAKILSFPILDALLKDAKISREF